MLICFLGHSTSTTDSTQNAAMWQAPLYEIAGRVPKRDSPLSWTDAARKAFRTCREALAHTARLIHPLHDAPLNLSTHEPNIAVGAVLEKFTGGDWKPLGFFSRKLSGASAYDSIQFSSNFRLSIGFFIILSCSFIKW